MRARLADNSRLESNSVKEEMPARAGLSKFSCCYKSVLLLWSDFGSSFSQRLRREAKSFYSYARASMGSF